MWCAGEMTSARKHGIPIVPLYCDGFTFPDAESINNIQSVWTEEQQYTLTSHGISMEDIKAGASSSRLFCPCLPGQAAYRHISTLEGHALCRQMALQEQERLILDVASAATRGPRKRLRLGPQRPRKHEDPRQWGDSRNYGLWDPYVYLPYAIYRIVYTMNCIPYTLYPMPYRAPWEASGGPRWHRRAP